MARRPPFLRVTGPKTLCCWCHAEPRDPHKTGCVEDTGQVLPPPPPFHRRPHNEMLMVIPDSVGRCESSQWPMRPLIRRSHVLRTVACPVEPPGPWDGQGQR